ncbi:CPBP family intramembrane glutamic endopeptidase [Azotosporobacter soli]|uniref:CPBP family intramembrane glutamic endopeptidase n=1 Tax=Azotosporobacter soli TaxID=3055040 RepID=UPI0031FEE0D2
MLKLLCYGLLFLAVALLWLPDRLRVPLWSVAFALACLAGLLSGQLDGAAVLFIICLAMAVYLSEREELATWSRAALLLGVVFGSFALGAHRMPHFHNWLVAADLRISADASPISLYLNFDKTVPGLLLLGFAHPRIRERKEWALLAKRIWPLGGYLLALLLAFALASGKIRFDPKWPDCLPLWLLTNLFFVCMAEEAFFRGFLQRRAEAALAQRRGGKMLALALASLAFGAAHYGGGAGYVLIATLAGLCYGYAYQRTKRIEASILLHGLVNTVHFLFFTYPVLP